MIAIVWICSSFVRGAPIGINNLGYMWCGENDGKSEADNKESLADMNAEPAPGSYELVGVLS